MCLLPSQPIVPDMQTTGAGGLIAPIAIDAKSLDSEFVDSLGE
jgi:hypothetical protein